ncbi:MAG: acetyl-CoA carboxylase biotin carboxyl carrier protein [Phycisphaerae bacterium]|nr:acetyl-CoA carboxylase biotin carboxyl carrier protein [Phycisphaerae bacterium]
MDFEQIRKLTDLMVENNLTEVMVRSGDDRIVIRRAVPGAAASIPIGASPPVVVHPPPAANVPSAVPLPSPAASTDDSLLTIRSPMVGTFYSASDPDSPPFVQVGSRVMPDTVVCIIEAMKVFNEIKAEVSGVIEAVVVNNAQPVEFGQVLFKVTPK